MKMTSFLGLGLVSFACCSAIADDFTVWVNTTSVPSNVQLYDANGTVIGSGSVGGAEAIDLDGDYIDDYYRVELYFAYFHPGNYSIGADNSRWTSLLNLGAPGPFELSLEAFPNASAPMLSGGDDEAVTGFLDIQGNLMNFGTVSGTTGDPGIRFTFAPYSSTFDTLLSRYDPISSNGHYTAPQMSWSFLHPTSGPQTAMRLVSTGSLFLNGPNAAVYINGSAVATQSGIQSGQLSSFKLANAGVASAGSIVSGYGSSATALYSFASGVNATANTYGMAAFGRYNLIPSGSATSWNPVDDLFVIGNGTGTGSRSNAVTIKKNGTTSLHGAVFIGTSAAGSLSFLGGTGQRSMSIGTAVTGTDFLIAAGGATAADNPGGALILSAGAVQPGGSETAGSSILFKTADTSNGGVPITRMSVDAGGNISLGSTTVTPVGQKGQLVIGSYNTAKAGSLIIGAGSGIVGELNERQNALRVSDSGAVLVKESGDISMGEFTAGEQP
jgi:hypothetical protein